MKLIISLLLAAFSIPFSAQSQFYVGAYSGYNLASRLNFGAFTEYSVEEDWPAVLRVSYTYSVPYSKRGDERPTMIHIPSNVEMDGYFVKTKDVFHHQSIAFDYKQYGLDADASEGGIYGRAIIGLTFSTVKREWAEVITLFQMSNFDLFTIRQTSLNLGFAMGYDFQLTDKIYLYADIAAMLPYIELRSNSKEYEGLPEFSLGLQIGVKYNLF
jgi:hypothetical protein